MITLGRLSIEDPETWTEPVGEAVEMVGGVPTPGQRAGHKVTPALSTWSAGAGGQPSDRQRIRRQVRAMLGNIPYRSAAVYVAWDQDTEQNGWYVPGTASLALDGVDLSTAVWKLDGLELSLAGRRRTHRRAVRASIVDRRLSTTPRDILGRVTSTDFSGLTPLALTALPSTVTDPVAHGALVPPVLTVARAGYQSASMRHVVGLTDAVVESFEQAEANRNLGDVVIYDRQGVTTMLTAGPQTTWEEVYGPDQPLTAADVPVIENSLCRVSYDAANTDGLRVDVWTGSAWAEQGKVTIQRYAAAAWNDLDTLVGATVVEWSPERAVLRVTMSRAADTASRELVYVTLQRGWAGPRIEVYPARDSAGAIAGAGLIWSCVTAATSSADESAICIDAGSTGVIAATAGSGGVVLPNAALGAVTFSGENEIILIREAQAYDVMLAVLQAGAAKLTGNSTAAYGSTRNYVWVRHQTAGYISAHLGFAPHTTHQELDNGDFTAGAGTTLSAADATAIDATAASTTRTTDANAHVTLATFLSTRTGGYRVIARVRTTASTLNIYAKTTATTGATKTTTSTSYMWIDLGDIVADGSTLEIHMWATAAATTYLDRVEAFPLYARQTADPRYDGGRDLAQSVLYDSRSIPALVAR